MNNNGCIQRELANQCHIRASTVTSLFANMKKSGLIYRTANSSDRRTLNVFLTDKGKETYENNIIGTRLNGYAVDNFIETGDMKGLL